MNTRILLIEDEHSVASVIKKALMEDQYEVSLAMDGTSAWDHISRFTYDLFILDVMLPGGNGMDLCRKIRQQGIRTPVLMLTALGSVDLFVMWWLTSLAIGLAVLYRRRTLPIAVGLIGIYVIVAIAITAVRGAVTTGT